MFLKLFFVIIAITTTIVSVTNGENILFFNGFASHSHLVAFEPLVNRLADLGHNVTLFTPMMSKDRHPKVVHFCPQSVLDLQKNLNEMGEVVMTARMKSRYHDYFMQTDALWDSSVQICEVMYTSPDFIEWVKTSSYDLVVLDAFQRECSLPLAHIWGSKIIIFNPTTVWYSDQDSFGYGTESAGNLPFGAEWHGWWLSDSWAYEYRSVTWYIWRQLSYLPAYDRLVKTYLTDLKKGQNEVIPSVRQIEKRVSLYLINQHFSADLPRAFPPMVIPVGGMHCKESKGISDKKIRDYIEDPQSDGFVFVSFGSFLKVSALSDEKQAIFFEAMASFDKIKFLWKWEDEPPKNLPKNVFLDKWWPQQDLLAHPKCKGFISQGGMMSYQQSIFHGVPLIIMSGGADQISHGLEAEKHGFGINYEFSHLNFDTFKSAVKDLLENPKYSTKMKEMSSLFRDRPLSAVDLALYWTHYVLRYDESQLDHLKAIGFHLSWWERRLIHFWGFVFTLLSLTLVSIVMGVRFISRWTSLEKKSQSKNVTTRKDSRKTK